MHAQKNFTQKLSNYFLQLSFWAPSIFFSFLLIYNTLSYFDFSPNHLFIQERIPLFNISTYAICFYAHIAAGMFCIATALLQFSSSILKKQTKLHAWSGRIYVIVVLLIGAPTGMFMAFFAKGSMMERGLFMFMAIAWLYSTARGLACILNKNVMAHKQWMIRSYALAMTAVTFRIYHILFFMADWGHLENYEISLWISVLGNITFAEFLIYKKSKHYLKSFLT